MGSKPWFLMGDFNTTRFSSEKYGGNMNTDTAMEEFHECLFNLEIVDMPFLGPLYTWINRRAGDQFVARKLDLSLQNECSLDTYPNVVTEFLNPRLSDHCPLIVNLNDTLGSCPKKRYPFKIFNFWADHPAFLDLVEDAWNIEVYGTPMYKLTQKLRSVKTSLKAFNFHEFANIREKVVEAREALHQAQADMQGNPNDLELVGNEKVCLKKYHDLALAEEGFLKQKSRIQWLKLGDQNSSFFHKSVKARNSRNTIKSITLENGCRSEDLDTIKQEVINHFQSVLGSNLQDSVIDDYHIDGLVWSSDHLHILNSRVTHEEIKNALFSIDDSKAPGPDGFSSLFFKRAWNIVGNEVSDAVEYFFKTGCMLREINCTIIALVLKGPNPSSMHDYRPISCCNTIYKCISKIIAVRIKRCILDIICPAQTAFVQGCSIADNILLTQELMKNYHSDIGPPRCALKIDLKKAYNSIRWGCILNILTAMGTPNNLLRCIMACITSPKFSICVNGELTWFFASKRGLRQGDSLSHFLFLITMEAFLRSFSKAALHPRFDFHPRCKGINLTHMCFANDIFIFAKGNANSVEITMDERAKFETFSGMQVNKQKSVVFLAWVNKNVKATILSMTGFSLGSLPMKYLGVPLISSKLSHTDCLPLMDKMMARIQSWTSRSLSFAGRLQLISFVLYSIQTYWCSMFIIPKFTCYKIEHMFSGFLWSGKDVNARKLRLVGRHFAFLRGGWYWVTSC